MCDTVGHSNAGEERQIADVVDELWKTHPRRWIPKLAMQLQELLVRDQQTKRVDASTSDGVDAPRTVSCPYCRSSVVLPLDASEGEIVCSECGHAISLVELAKITRVHPPLRRIGDYELIEFLDAGAFGSVWKARDLSLLTAVAIKIPHQKPLSPRDQDRVKSEARAQGQLDHPNIVRIRSVIDDGETLYIVSDLIRGVRLSDWLAVKRPTIQQSVQWCIKISDALQHAHERRVFHRDLKPANILIDGDGEPHLTDFGLAKHDLDRVTMTSDGQVLGTAAYMSSEQADGRGHNADGRSDIYSLGVILFELLTGQLPFRGTERAVIHAHVHEPPPSPRAFNDRVARDLETICLKCLEKDANSRFQSAGELRDELQRYLQGEPILSRPIGRAARTWRLCQRNPLVASLCVLVMTVLLAGTAVSSFFAVQAMRGQAATANALYRSLVDQARATRIARQQGYRVQGFNLLKEARALQTANVDFEELRQEAVACMGDFVGLEPLVIRASEGRTIETIGIHPASKQLAIAFDDGSCRIYDVAEGSWDTEVIRHQAPVRSIHYSADGGSLTTLDANGMIQTAKLGVVSDSPIARKLGKPDASGDLRWLVSSDGTKALVASAGRIELRDLAGDTSLSVFEAGKDQSYGAVSLSPDGRLLAVHVRQGQENELQLWDCLTRDVQRKVPIGGTPYPNALAFSQDAQALAMGYDAGLVLFDASDLRPVLRFRSAPVRAVAISPDNDLLATLDIRGQVEVHSIATNKVIATLSQPRSYVTLSTGVRFSDDSSLLVTYDAETIQAWRLRGALERMSLDGHRDAVPCVTFSPTEGVLATGSKDRSVKLWNAHTGELIGALGPFRGMVQNLAFSPDGKLLAVAQWSNGDDDLQFWDVATRQRVAASWWNPERQADQSVVPQYGEGDVCRIAFVRSARYGEHFAAAGEFGVRIWKLTRPPKSGGASALRLTPIDHRAEDWGGTRSFDCVFSPNGDWLVWVDKVRPDGDVTGSQRRENRLRLWDFASTQASDVQGPRLLQEWHSLVTFPDNHSVGFVGVSGTIEKWTVGAGSQSTTFDKLGRFQSPHIALTNDGRWLAGKAAPTELLICDMERQRRLFLLMAEASEIISLAWSLDGHQLAIGLHDGRAVIWDFRRVNQELRQLELNLPDDRIP